MTTPTYAEAKGSAPFDWYAFLRQPQIDEDEWTSAIERARNWTTCACGNQCAVIPRHREGEPKDDVLAHLGGADGFLQSIKDHDQEGALNLLDLIEARSTYLIAQINRSAI